MNEFKTFIWRNGKPQAMKSYNDDLIMALAIACWVRDTAIQASARDLNYQKGYKSGNATDIISEAKSYWDEYKWIIK